MFEMFRTLFLLHEAVALDWAVDQGFVDGQLIARVRERFRLHPTSAPHEDQLYDEIRDAVADRERQVARVLALELARRLVRPADPRGTWTSLDRSTGPFEEAVIGPRLDSDHPHDYWVVLDTNVGAMGAAARFEPGTGRLDFTEGARELSAPWRLLPPSVDDEAPLWLKAPAVREARSRGWLVADTWIDPGAVRRLGEARVGWALTRRSPSPRESSLSVVLDRLTERWVVS